MFPEYRELISTLKTSDARFARLFNEHNELDEKINNLVKLATSDDAEITALKQKKLALKDELYTLLKKASEK